MSSHEQSFDDPALKAAIKSACGCDCAPERLKAAIIARCCVREAIGRSRWRLGSVGKLAAAVGILIGAAAAVVVWGNRPVLAQQAVAELVQRHNGCCDEDDHHGVPGNDVQTAGLQLANKVHHPVLAADLTKDQFEFHGGAICPVGKCSGVHLVFRRGNERVSVFTVMAKDLGAKGEGNIQEQVGDRAVAGYVKDGEVYCMVGHGGQMNVDELKRVMDEHRNEVRAATLALAR